MNVNCSCGGRFKRTDIQAIYSPNHQRVVYQDTDGEKANWRCDKCGEERSQKKRQSTLPKELVKVPRTTFKTRNTQNRSGGSDT